MTTTVPTLPPRPSTIANLPDAGAIDGHEFIAVSQRGVTVKITANELSSSLLPGPPNTLTGYSNTGIFSDVTVSTGLSLTDGVLSATGFVPSGTPNTLAGYNNSGTFSDVTIGAGLLLTGSALSSTNTASSVVGAGWNNFIITPQSYSAALPGGLTLNLPSGTANMFGSDVPFAAITDTLSANSIYDYWLNPDGTWTIESEPNSNYTALPHFTTKLHIWQIQTGASAVTAQNLQGNPVWPTVYRPNDIAGSIDTFAEIFYLYPTATNWSSSLTVTYGELLLTSTGNVYQVEVPGVTGGSAPTSTAPGAITDGSATLFYYCQSSYLGMFRYAPNNGTEYYFTNIGLEQVCHKTLLTGSPLGEPAGTTMASLIKGYLQGAIKHVIGNRVNSGTYVFGMKMIAGGYIWLNTTVAGGTAAGSSPFSGSYTPGTSTVVDGTITWLCIYTSYASQEWFWMDVDATYLNYRSPDSHDSYASTFASLVARYIQLTNDYSWMTGASAQPSGSGTYWTYQQIFGYIINTNLDTQISNFLTLTFQNSVSPVDGSSFTTQYLEDSCESVKGYRGAAYVYQKLGDATRYAAAFANIAYVGSGVAGLYNTTYNLFGWYYGDTLSWATNANIGWYPYLQAQFFPELCSVGTINDDQFKLVRYNVSLNWPDYFDSKAIDIFPNNFLGFMAAKCWQDTNKAYDFVEKTERYFISGGTVAQGHLTPAAATDITEWGYYLGAKDALVAPLTVLNTNGNTLNLLNNSGGVVPIAASPSADPAWITGKFYGPPLGATQTTFLTVTGTLYAYPIFIPNQVTVASLSIDVTTGQTGGAVHIGIYADNAGYPGTLVYDSGAVTASSTAIATKSSVSTVLTPGIYWLATIYTASSTFITVQAISPVYTGVLASQLGFDTIAHAFGTGEAATGITVSATYGALPGVFPSGAAYAQNAATPLVVIGV